jgi:phosphotriesterase-related protein
MKEQEDDPDYTFKIILWLILFLVFGIIIIACKPASKDYIMTVNGPVDLSQTGVTLTHEHILVDFIAADSTGYFRWNKDSVIKKALPYVIEVREKGVKTIFDCSPAYLGRDPVILKRLSDETGVNFITNTGYYGFTNIHLPAEFYDLSTDKLAEIWIDEFKNGIEGTGIKPGFIKIAVDPTDSLAPKDVKLITAAALTHLATGLTIASHTGPEKPAFEQIEILKKAGVDPSAFIWVHAQQAPIEMNIEAAKTGTWISLDNVRNRPGIKADDPFTIEWYANRIADLKNQGLLDKVLISHDSGWYDPAKPGGGSFDGFTDIFEFLIPALKDKGFTQEDIDLILVRNPREAYKVNIRPYITQKNK